MQAVPIALAVVGGGLGAAAGALFARKPKVPPPAMVPTRTDAQTLGASEAEFRKRKGAAANILTGPSGAEAPSPGAKALLGQ
jgi:hypothetical protein